MSKPVADLIGKIKVGSDTSRQACEVLGLTADERFKGWPVEDLLKVVKKNAGTTKGVKAHRYEVQQVCAVAFVTWKTASYAFLGGDLRQLVELTKWLLKSEGKVDPQTGEVFDPDKALESWKAKREEQEAIKAMKQPA